MCYFSCVFDTTVDESVSLAMETRISRSLQLSLHLLSFSSINPDHFNFSWNIVLSGRNSPRRLLVFFQPRSASIFTLSRTIFASILAMFQNYLQVFILIIAHLLYWCSHRFVSHLDLSVVVFDANRMDSVVELHLRWSLMDRIGSWEKDFWKRGSLRLMHEREG